MNTAFKPISSFGKGLLLAMIALPALPFIVVRSYIDIDTISQLMSQFFM